MIEHSDSDETSITAFKRIKCGDWASDIPRMQEESYEATEADRMDDERETWPDFQPIPMNVDQMQKQVQPFIQEQPPSQQQKSSVTLSSYWSVPEQCDFHNYLRYFGTDWQSIAIMMKTKTPIMVRNPMSDEVTNNTDVFLGQELL